MSENQWNRRQVIQKTHEATGTQKINTLVTH